MEAALSQDKMTDLSPQPTELKIGRKLMTSPPRSVLIVSPLRIGDALLATPLARSIKHTWPQTEVDFLVLPGSQGVLVGNPDIRHVHVFAQRVSLREKIRQLRSVWNQYDLALATQASDRSRIFAKAAARITIGFVTQESGASLKARLLDQAIAFDNMTTHTVSLNARLLAPLGIPFDLRVINPQCEQLVPPLTSILSDSRPVVVIHPNPKFPYKMWTRSGWIELGRWLRSLGCLVVLTGSPEPEEKQYVDTLAESIGEGCTSLAGQLSLAQTTHLLERARLYIGPDTAVTHMAAASGVPTVALFGPSNPVKWGPWPANRNQTDSPWPMRGSGHCGNVWLVQGAGDCVPCLGEGCDRKPSSTSRCLQELPLHKVKTAVSQALATERSVAADEWHELPSETPLELHLQPRPTE